MKSGKIVALALRTLRLIVLATVLSFWPVLFPGDRMWLALLCAALLGFAEAVFLPAWRDALSDALIALGIAALMQFDLLSENAGFILALTYLRDILLFLCILAGAAVRFLWLRLRHKTP